MADGAYVGSLERDGKLAVVLNNAAERASHASNGKKVTLDILAMQLGRANFPGNNFDLKGLVSDLVLLNSALFFCHDACTLLPSWSRRFQCCHPFLLVCGYKLSCSLRATAVLLMLPFVTYQPVATCWFTDIVQTQMFSCVMSEKRLTGWRVFPLPLDNLEGLQLPDVTAEAAAPATAAAAAPAAWKRAHALLQPAPAVINLAAEDTVKARLAKVIEASFSSNYRFSAGLHRSRVLPTCTCK